SPADCRIRGAGCIGKHGSGTKGRVAVARGVAIEGVPASGSVEGTLCVIEQRERPKRRIAAADRVQQKRGSSNGCIFGSIARIWISDVKEQSPRTDGCVETAINVAPERKPTDCCVCIAGAGVETQEGALPFCGVQPGIAAAGCRGDCLRSWRKRKAGEPDRDEKERKPQRRPAD